MADYKEKKLNKEQLAAVKHGEGPLLIIAGAGTGKTLVLTERIKYLVVSGRAKPSEILALTFTEKAAREMEERVDIAMPYGYTQMWISTFHAFGDRVLRQEALHIGLSPRYNLLTEAEIIQFLRQNLFKFNLNYFRPLGNPTKFIAGLIQHFSRLKDEDVSVTDYLKYAAKIKEPKTFELAAAYQTYEELKIKEGIMDFADLIFNLLKLFRQRKDILKQYQDQFKYILVDEFQDTNYAQNQVAMLLVGKKANLTVSGDDDQSIYRFRGAAISNIIQFRQNYPQAKMIVLVKNYRSTQLILDHAYQLIQHNNPDRLEVKEKINKHLQAVRKDKSSPIKFFQADRVENEAEIVAQKIGELTKENYQYKDIAILVRANNQAEPFTRALSRARIPYQFLGPGMLFRQPEVKDLIAYLKVLVNFEDSVAMYRILGMDIFALPGRDLAALSNYSRNFNLSLFEACEQIQKIFVSSKTKETIKKLTEMIYRHLELIKKETAGQILYYFLENTELLKKLAEPQSIAEERRAQNISKFFDKLKNYEAENEDASVFAVADWIDLSMELGESPLAANLDWTETNAVNLLTVHSAKGLEFPVVFLVNLVVQRFPTLERREQIPLPETLIKEILPVGDYHLEEERRLFYVGMTRAKERLFFTAANYYGEGKRERKVSPFVIEALGEKVLLQKTAESSGQLSIFAWQKQEEIQLTAINHSPINYLSYSQIETYDTCPLQYRYRYLQRLPAPPSAAQSFGDSIHKALRDFYQTAKNVEKPTEKDLLTTFENNWSSLGYASKAHEKKMKEQGEKILKAFFQKGFEPKIKTISLEQTFVIKISPTLKIGGKIDRIDKTKFGLEIIDYKTGKAWEQKKVEESLQMTVYALAAADPGIYGCKPEEISLSFYFLETGEKKSTSRTSEQFEKAKKEILEKAREIEKSAFEPKPSRMCDFCEYRLLCEAWT